MPFIEVMLFCSMQSTVGCCIQMNYITELFVIQNTVKWLTSLAHKVCLNPGSLVLVNESLLSNFVQLGYAIDINITPLSTLGH